MSEINQNYYSLELDLNPNEENIRKHGKKEKTSKKYKFIKKIIYLITFLFYIFTIINYYFDVYLPNSSFSKIEKYKFDANSYNEIKVFEDEKSFNELLELLSTAQENGKNIDAEEFLSDLKAMNITLSKPQEDEIRKVFSQQKNTIPKDDLNSKEKKIKPKTKKEEIENEINELKQKNIMLLKKIKSKEGALAFDNFVNDCLNVAQYVILFSIPICVLSSKIGAAVAIVASIVFHYASKDLNSKRKELGARSINEYLNLKENEIQTLRNEVEQNNSKIDGLGVHLYIAIKNEVYEELYNASKNETKV